MRLVKGAVFVPRDQTAVQIACPRFESAILLK